MKYKNINLLDNPPNQSSKFRTKSWVEINNALRGAYNTNSQIKFETSMLESSLRDYSDAYIAFKRTITVPDTRTAPVPNNKDREVVFENCAPFTDHIR